MSHLNVKPQYVLGRRSQQRLRGVHPMLVKVVERAIQITYQDFAVHAGVRTIAQQREYVRRGVSKTMNSLHLPQSDGYGHAVDLVPYVSGSLRWEWLVIYPIASAMRIASEELRVPLIWGAVWDRNFEHLPKDPNGLKAEVNAYVDRRRAMGRSAFIDGPHYQLRL